MPESSEDEHTMAKSIITYDTKTTKKKVINDDDSSNSSLESWESMNREQLLAKRKEAKEKMLVLMEQIQLMMVL